MPELRIARSELILGGRRSGKTARAEALAAAWLALSPDHRAVYIATAQAWDEDMRERVALEERQHGQRVPRMVTLEDPLELAHAVGRHSRADTLIVVDCLTLWLTALLMRGASGADSAAGPPPPEVTMAGALGACAGPIVLISNEIGSGAIPQGRNARRFIDALGGLNQQAAAACERVTLMSAGLPLTLKGAA